MRNRSGIQAGRWRAGWAAALLALASICVAAQPALSTPEELGRFVESECLRQEPQVRASLQAGGGQVMDIIGYPQYCRCVKEGLVARASTELIRTGTAEQGEKLVRSVAATCLEGGIKRVFSGDTCPRFLRSLAPQDALVTEEGLAVRCACIERSIEDLHGVELVAAMEDVSRTVREMRTNGRNGNPPSYVMERFKSCMGEAFAPSAGRLGP